MEHQEVLDQLKLGIETIIRLMVDTPEQVRVEFVAVNANLTAINLYTAPQEAGFAIGSHGRLAKSVRELVWAIASKHRCGLQYEVVTDFRSLGGKQ